MPTIINSVPALVVPEPTLAASRLESMNACPGFIKDIFERNMDAADDGKKKMLATLKASSKAAEEQGLPGADRPHFELLDSAQLGLALGIESVIHAAPTQGAAGEAAVKRAQRLARYIAN